MRFPLHVSDDGDRILGIHLPEEAAELVTWRVKASQAERVLRLPDWPAPEAGVVLAWTAGALTRRAWLRSTGRRVEGGER